MGYELNWEANERGVTQRYFGDVTAADIAASTNKLQSSPAFDRLRWLIKDYTEVDNILYSQSEMEEVVAQYIGAFATNPRLKIAFVFNKEEFFPRLNRAIEMLRSSKLKDNTFEFETSAQARIWANWAGTQ